jgi:DNA-binding winged helix-turn-helix (wHTH) protein
MAIPAYVWVGAALLAVACAAGGYVSALVATRGKRAGASAAVADRLADADQDAAIMQALERVASAPNRKVWADRVSVALVSFTGASGGAVVLRSPASDSMSLAGSSVPLVIRNLETSLREPHGPSQRALASGEPVSMSAGELPAWAAAAGYEAGAVIPVLFHGASIGLAYALGKEWESPSAASLVTASRFVSLAAVHYALAVPYPAATAPTPAPAARVSPSLSSIGSAVASPVPSVSYGQPDRVIRPAPVAPPGAAAPAAPSQQLVPAPAVQPLMQPPAASVARPPALAQALPAQRRRIDLSGVALDPALDRCIVDGRAVSLSRTEFDLLYALASNGGDIVAAKQLVHTVWGDAGTPAGTLDVTVHRVRKKLGQAPGGADLVRTVRGRGYAIGVPAPKPAGPAGAPARAAAD